MEIQAAALIWRKYMGLGIEFVGENQPAIERIQLGATSTHSVIGTAALNVRDS